MNFVRNQDIHYPELSYKLTGLFFQIHNKYGRFKSEKQYCDYFEEFLKERKYSYVREKNLKNIYASVIEQGNIPDFMVENKIIIDFKSKKFVTKDDYFQMMRYLECTNLPLGIIVNFRSTYLKPKRIINPKFHSIHSSAHS